MSAWDAIPQLGAHSPQIWFNLTTWLENASGVQMAVRGARNYCGGSSHHLGAVGVCDADVAADVEEQRTQHGAVVVDVHRVWPMFSEQRRKSGGAGEGGCHAA